MRKNRAAVRYGVWMAASVKFLIPFSLLVSAGAQLEWRKVPITAPPQISAAIDEIAKPFAAQAPAPLPAVASPALNPWPAILFAVWLGGIAIGIVFWVRCWWQVRSMRRAATPLELNLPVKVMSSPTHREPGVLGIRKPCLLLPEGITDRLTPPQLEAILAHELRHVERRDNLTAAIHMLVETIFWFHPCVWWIRARLMEERERACDEEVVRMGSEPQVYAESILRVLPCAARALRGSDRGRTKETNRGHHGQSHLSQAEFRAKTAAGRGSHRSGGRSHLGGVGGGASGSIPGAGSGGGPASSRRPCASGGEPSVI
jgi:beta-lactamase regulating signal transducer with metallopeptidase domain